MDSNKDFRWALVVIVLLIGLGAIGVFLRHGSKGTEEIALAPTEDQSAAVKSLEARFKHNIPHPAAFPKVIMLLPVAEESLKLNGADTTPQDDLELLQFLLEGYRRAMKENPSGENADIIAALMGKNSRGVAVIPTNHPALSAEGQLLDRWGTPYFFHSVSSQAMEIISAGPDKRLWTQDDIVLR